MDLQSTRPVGEPDRSWIERPAYANIMHVSSTPYDVRITFSLLRPSQDPSSPTFGADLGTIVPQATAEVVVPVAAVDGFVEVLQAELRRFVEHFGNPGPSLPHAATVSA